MNPAKIKALDEVRGYVTDDLVAEVTEILAKDKSASAWHVDDWLDALDGYILRDDPGKDKACIAERLANKPTMFKAAVKQGAKYGIAFAKGIMRLEVYGDNVSAKVDSKGLLQLIFKAGVYTSADRVIVFKGERFQPLPADNPPRIIHHPNYEIERTQENCIGAYIMLRGPGVPPKFLVVDSGQIASSAEKGGSLYYGPDWQEMVKWIPLRKIVKELDENPAIRAMLDDEGAYTDDTAAPSQDTGASITDRIVDHGEGDTKTETEPLPDAADVAGEET